MSAQLYDADIPLESNTFLTALARHKWSAAAGFLIVVIGAMVLSYRHAPVYGSSADVLVPAPIANVAAGGTVQFGQVVLPDQVAIAVSEPILLAVAERLHYQGDPQELARHVHITPSKGAAQVLTFEVEAPTAKQAAALADAFVEEYLGYENTKALDSLKQKLDIFKGQLADKRQELAHTRDTDLSKVSILTSQILTLSNSMNDYQAAIEQVEKGLGEVLSPAAIEPKPIRPDHVRDLIVALLAGFFVAVAIAMLLESLDSSLRGIRDVESLAGAPLLASIPHFSHKRSEGSGLVILDDPRSAASEAYRSLKTSIMFGQSQQELRVLVVTSASKGDGKSTTASNLAAVLAQADEKVLLVDADLRRPSQHRIFKISSTPGMSEVLAMKTRFVDAVQKSPVPRLRVLPSGSIPPNPVELLGSAAMEAFLEQVGDLFDWLIIDAPPVLGVADASVLASRANGVLFVVGEGTSRRTLAHARNELGKVDATIAGAVLNNLTRNSRTYYPEYGYRRYAYYEASGDDVPTMVDGGDSAAD